MNDDTWDVSEDVDIEEEHYIDPDTILVIRNNAPLALKEKLTGILGDASSFGRYFIPTVRDMDKIYSIARKLKLYVKVSKLSGVTVVDIMYDKTKMRKRY